MYCYSGSVTVLLLLFFSMLVSFLCRNMQNEINNKTQRTPKCEFSIWAELHRDGDVTKGKGNWLCNVLVG
jgi:hypothetical protein